MVGTESHDFSDYEPTTVNPGIGFTIGVVALCVFVNLFLPLFVGLAHRRDRRRNEKAMLQETEDGDVRDKESNAGKSLSNFPNASALKQHDLKNHDPYSGSPVNRLYQNATKTSSHGGDDNVSVVSAETNVSARSNLSLILEHRPHKLSHPRRRRHHGRRGTTPLDTASVRNETGSDAPLSVVDIDDISTSDAIDAKAGGVGVKKQRSRWEKFLEIADWDVETKRLVSLTVPYFIEGVGEGIFSIVEVAIIGNLVGVMEANIVVTVSILVEFSETLNYGFTEAIGTLVPQARGAGNKLLMGRYLQLGFLLNLIMTIPPALVWFFFTEDAVLWLGFDEETASTAQRYAYPFLITMFLDGIDDTLHEFLDVVGHERFSTISQVLCDIVETSVLILIIKVGVTDIVHIAIIQAIVELILFIINLAFILWKGWLDDYWEGLTGSLSFRDRRAVHTTVITAIPLSLSWFLTYGEWEMMTIFAVSMGPAEVAAWGMLGYIWDTFEYVTESFADAAEVRVGFRMGAGQPRHARLASYKCIYLGFVVAVLSAGILFVLSEHIPRWLTPDATLQKMIFDVIPLMGFGQILLIVGTTSWGVICAQGRVRLATAIDFASSWFVAIPLCAVSAYVLNFNIVGFVAALVFGYSIGGVALGYIILRSDWNRLSQSVISRNIAEGVTWNDNEWEELPDYVQSAALTLGFTKDLWDNDKDPPLCEQDWKRLTQEQKEAAQILGYNRATWDDDSSEEGATSNDQSKYEDYDWDELPSDIQEAARILGYTKELWDEDGKPESDNKSWRQLSPQQQEAAIKIGYSKETWDDDSSCDSSKKKGSQKYDDMDWSELPADIKDAARVLGYTKKLWNNDGSPEAEEKSWRRLTPEQQEAATKLGYNEQNWDDDDDDSSSSSSSSEEAAAPSNYDDYDWQELPPDIKDAARVLGYTKKLWNRDGSPECDDKSWRQLSAEEQAAATKLGYNEQTWDEDSDSSSSSS